MKTTIFLAGDVMTGRGVDQILAHPSAPALDEPYVKDARDYVQLVEQRSGRIPRPVSFDYVWGDARDEMARADARVVNLETSVTRDGQPWPDKEVHYRMHPDNVGCLVAARLDVCTLANNHVLDYGHEGLRETLSTLRAAKIRATGAGLTRDEARAPAIVPLGDGARLLVFSIGSPTSGVRPSWMATDALPGVDLVEHLTRDEAERTAERLRAYKQRGDVVIASIHWGSNYGWDVSDAFVRFAHVLVDGGVDVVHGHSSHHPRGIEVYRGKLVLYGCGDLVNDYEAIDADEEFRIDLPVAYFATIDASDGGLVALRLLPLHMRRMRLERASSDDASWVATKITQASRRFGTSLARVEDGALALRWNA